MGIKITGKHLAIAALISTTATFANYKSTILTAGTMSADPDPIGLVLVWGKETVPTGWLEMNAGYPDLAAVYGSNLPDLRGRFVRGFGGNSGAIGQVQLEELKGHSHSASFVGDQLPSHSHTGVVMDEGWTTIRSESSII